MKLYVLYWHATLQKYSYLTRIIPTALTVGIPQRNTFQNGIQMASVSFTLNVSQWPLSQYQMPPPPPLPPPPRIIKATVLLFEQCYR